MKQQGQFNQEVYIKHHLRKQLLLFRSGWLTPSAWKKLLHDKDEKNLFTDKAIFDLRNKCKYFTKSIEYALKDYEKKGWIKCCADAINDINSFEHTDELEFDDDDNFNKRWVINDPKTVSKWYINFNHTNSGYFINQFNNCRAKSLPKFLDNNPDVTKAVMAYCNNNLLNLTSEGVQHYIIETCLPKLLKKRQMELGDESINMEYIMKENNIKIITRQTVCRWLKLLGFSYCERKKSYYCDSHERPETVAYRYKFIDRYLERELRCFRWIQISEKLYLTMKEEGSIFGGEPYQYTNDKGEKYFEFHVDDNIEFAKWTTWPDEDSERFGGCLSVRMPEGAKPLIIFGQDECIFKQYTFSKKSWMGPEGQTALVPKEEGQGLMLSSFVS